ncbi:microtubule or microtubule-binding cytoskeletal protein [Lithospermum erythrorhizon]|uniref:Microtubule or microtubule-binding cytoskeletal protein n=1 Tax=Lithospermum erythrorhizon TaxID=34254 RepID=A0AAV3PR27_LITER
MGDVIVPTENLTETVNSGLNWKLISYLLFVTESLPKPNGEVVPEEKDPQYNAMLSQMVGRIQAKPGGKPEMGEAVVVEKYDRPLPKVRNTTPESSRYEERPAPAGTLNVAQLRHIMLLYQGKADDHDGPMDIAQIAARFQMDASQVKRIVQSVSLLPEDSSKRKNDL